MNHAGRAPVPGLRPAHARPSWHNAGRPFLTTPDLRIRRLACPSAAVYGPPPAVTTLTSSEVIRAAVILLAPGTPDSSCQQAAR